MDKLLNFLGICRRAGKLAVGNDVVIDAVRGGEAKLVMLCSDISTNTEKKLRKTIDESGVRILRLNRSKEELGFAIGKFAAITAATDKGFADKLCELINNETGGISV